MLHFIQLPPWNFEAMESLGKSFELPQDKCKFDESDKKLGIDFNSWMEKAQRVAKWNIGVSERWGGVDAPRRQNLRNVPTGVCLVFRVPASDFRCPLQVCPPAACYITWIQEFGLRLGCFVQEAGFEDLLQLDSVHARTCIAEHQRPGVRQRRRRAKEFAPRSQLKRRW